MDHTVIRPSFSELVAHLFLNLLEDTRCRESWEDLPLELQVFSINAIHFAEEVVL